MYHMKKKQKKHAILKSSSQKKKIKLNLEFLVTKNIFLFFKNNMWKKMIPYTLRDLECKNKMRFNEVVLFQKFTWYFNPY